jgi:hypothetical protein
MQQLAGLLTEVNIAPAGMGNLPKDLKEVIEKLEENSYFMFDSGSPEDDEPISDGADIDEIYLDGEISEDEYNTVKKYIGKQFVSDVLLHPYDVPNPNKPRSGFNTFINVSTYDHNENCYIDAEVPNIDETGVQTGWFNQKGEYISTVNNINEVNISVPNIPRFTTDRSYMYGDVPDWDQTPDTDRVRYIDYINYNSPKYNMAIEGSRQTDDWFVESKNPNPIIFGVVIGNEQEEGVFQELRDYLRSNGIQYNVEEYDDGEDGELYLSVSLDDLKKKQLFKK